MIHTLLRRTLALLARALAFGDRADRCGVVTWKETSTLRRVEHVGYQNLPFADVGERSSPPLAAVA